MIEPGCFGVPSIFSFKSNICGQCSHSSGCQVASQQALLSIRESSVVTDILNQHINHSTANGLTVSQASEKVFFAKSIPLSRLPIKPRYALTASQIELLESAPKKVRSFLLTTWTRGNHLELISRAKAGLNPFDADKNRPYYLACRELIANKRVARIDFVNRIMEEFDWTYSAAYSQVSLIWHVLPALELSQVDGAFMRYSFPDAKRHNT